MKSLVWKLLQGLPMHSTTNMEAVPLFQSVQRLVRMQWSHVHISFTQNVITTDLLHDLGLEVLFSQICGRYQAEGCPVDLFRSYCGGNVIAKALLKKVLRDFQTNQHQDKQISIIHYYHSCILTILDHLGYRVTLNHAEQLKIVTQLTLGFHSHLDLDILLPHVEYS